MDPDTFARLARQAPFHDAGHGYDVFGPCSASIPPTLSAAVSAGAMLYDKYFRVDSRGIEQVPATGAAILVANPDLLTYPADKLSGFGALTA